MKTPTLKEIRLYFKDAKVVECLYNADEIDITKGIIKEIYFKDADTVYLIDIDKHRGTNVKLWSKKYGYAEILKYKGKQMDNIETKVTYSIKLENGGKVYTLIGFKTDKHVTAASKIRKLLILSSPERFKCEEQMSIIGETKIYYLSRTIRDNSILYISKVTTEDN